jgi:hypothetical protein
VEAVDLVVGVLNGLVDGVVVVELDEAEAAFPAARFFGQVFGAHHVAELGSI